MDNKDNCLFYHFPLSILKLSIIAWAFEKVEEPAVEIT